MGNRRTPRRITDDAIWAAIRDEAATHGWADETRLIHGAVTAIGRRLRLSDDNREVIAGRARKLWSDRMISYLGAG